MCNPFCGPCAKAHPVLEEIIQQRSNVRLKVIFTQQHGEGEQVVKHLLSLAAKGSQHETEQALDFWYGMKEKNYATFAAQFPLDELHPDGLKEMAYWCELAQVTHTPTIFINGYRLPENYRIEELRQLL